MRKRKIVFLLIATVLFCFASREQLASASYEKPKSFLPEKIDVEKESARFRVLKKVSVRLTAYYGPRTGQKKYVLGSYRKDVRMNGAGKETRSGTVPDIGTVAADWRIFPPGTKLRILDCDVALGEGSSRQVSEIIFTVEDTGGAVKNRHVDIFTGFGDHGRKMAEKINDLQKRKFVIEVVECQP